MGSEKIFVICRNLPPSSSNTARLGKTSKWAGRGRISSSLYTFVVATWGEASLKKGGHTSSTVKNSPFDTHFT